jgi:hypothetical protein
MRKSIPPPICQFFRVLVSVHNLMYNSPPESCFVNGSNIGLCNRFLNCTNPQSSGFADNGNIFSKSSESTESLASIQVLPDSKCAASKIQFFPINQKKQKFSPKNTLWHLQKSKIIYFCQQ